MQHSERRPSPGTLRIVVGAGLLLLALLAWGVASPVGASPDEDYHLVSAWCGAGDREDLCEEGQYDDQRIVPSALVEAGCFAFDPTMSASCQGKPGGYVESYDDLVPTTRGNFTGDYPPVFFLAMSPFAGQDISASAVAMRAVNALLFVAVLVATFLALPARLGRALVAGSVVSLVPLGMFIVPAVNPSSWAVLSALTLLVSLVGYLTTDDRRQRIVLGVLAGLAVLLGAGARADAAIYAVVAVVAALLLAGHADRRGLLLATYPAALAVVAGLSYLSSGQSSAVDGGADGPTRLEPVRLAELALDVPELWVGALGGKELGWLDTELPAVVPVLVGSAFAAILFVALAGARSRALLAVAVVGGALWMVPTWVQYLSGAPVGSFVQARYILPLVVLLVMTSLASVPGPGLRLTQVQRWLLVGAVSSANAVALHVNLRRYVTGSDVGGVDLDEQIEWWWGAPISPMALWALGALAFFGALVAMTDVLVERAQVVSPDTRVETYESRAADTAGPHGDHRASSSRASAMTELGR